MNFSTHIFWHYMFYAPVVEGVKITLLLAVASQAAGVLLGVIAALGRLSNFRLGPRFAFYTGVWAFLAWAVHPVINGEFDSFWIKQFGWQPAGGVENWLIVFLSSLAVLTLIAGLLGRFLPSPPRLLAWLASKDWYPFRTLSGIYIWLFRGTPLLVQLFFVYFAVPQMTNGGILIDAIPSAFIALALNEGAYMAEIVRSGIASVDAGQTEAAQSLGMTRAKLMRRIVLPQAIRIIIPPTGNEFISMLKNTSLAYSIGVTELFYETQIISTSGTGLGSQQFFPLAAVSATWYLLLTTVFTFLQTLIERHYQKGFVREAGMSFADQFLADIASNLGSWRRSRYVYWPFRGPKDGF